MFTSEKNIESLQEEVLLAKCVGSFINRLQPAQAFSAENRKNWTQ